MWIDSHCHLQLGLRDQPPAPVDAVVERARAAGIEGLVCVGTDLVSSRAAVDVAHRYPDVHATVGLHPHDASRLPDERAGLEALLRDAPVVGVGETGFDLHYEHSPREDQEVAFRWQIRLAHELDLALVVHSREAWSDTFRVLADEGVPPRTVFHCFTGGPDEAREALELGAHLSFSGIVSFRGADDVRAAAALTPDARLLVETDSPYLAPEPHRGRPNEPAHLVAVAEALAEARVEPVEHLAEVTAGNARRVFGLPAP